MTKIQGVIEEDPNMILVDEKPLQVDEAIRRKMKVGFSWGNNEFPREHEEPAFWLFRVLYPTTSIYTLFHHYIALAYVLGDLDRYESWEFSAAELREQIKAKRMELNTGWFGPDLTQTYKGVVSPDTLVTVDGNPLVNAEDEDAYNPGDGFNWGYGGGGPWALAQSLVADFLGARDFDESFFQVETVAVQQYVEKKLVKGEPWMLTGEELLELLPH